MKGRMLHEQLMRKDEGNGEHKKVTSLHKDGC